MKRRIILVLAFLAAPLMAVGCGADEPTQITIDVSDYDGYPAAFVDLSEQSVEEASPIMERGGEISADLWVEPGDPEIGGLAEEFAGLRHIGSDVELAGVLNASLGEVSEVPVDVQWRDGVSGSNLAGHVFLVRDSEGALYKMTVEPVNEQRLILHVARMSE